MLTALAAFHSDSDLQTVLQLLRTGDVNARASQVRPLLLLTFYCTLMPAKTPIRVKYSLWITFNSLTVTVLVFGSTCVFAGWSDSTDARRESRARGYGPGAVVLRSSGQHPWWWWLHCPHVCLWAWSCGHCSSATLCPRLWCDTHR